MEPPGGVPPDRDRQLVLKQMVTFHERPDASLCGKGGTPIPTTAVTPNPAFASTATTYSATTQAATAFSGASIGHALIKHHGGPAHHGSQSLQSNSSGSSSSSSTTLQSSTSSGSGATQQQTLEKLSRPMAFDKMEALVREMQDPDHGVPVRQQKMFLTSIPYAFMGYDLIEWLMDRLQIEESEALNIANQLCLHGYFFPVNDSKTLSVKDDSSLYRFQTPYYWPWQHKAPDNVEYAIYLVKRSLRNKQRHALEDYEVDALASLHKNLKGKWEIISMQAEEQVRLAKERKKGEKIVGDSQERAYWRVHRPPPGQFTPLEACPVPSRDRQGTKQNKKKTVEDMQRDVDYLKKSLNRTRMKMSQACESLVAYSETFSDYDFFLQPVLPSNPWVTEDVTFWQLNNTFVDIPTEKRVKRWAISIEELVSDPTGLQEFTTFLEKEYSHENIRFWIAVNRLRRSAHSQVPRKVQEIYEEFLKPGAPCEINIDGKTMESVLKGLKNPSRFTFDAASDHIYMLLLKKDCYPRFIRSDHYKRLVETGIQPSHKKRFFNFGGVSGAKKKMTAALSSQPNLGGNNESSSKSTMAASGNSFIMSTAPPPGSLTRRRGSDRSLSGSAHELAVMGVNKDSSSKVPHSHSQSNLSEIPFRDTPKGKAGRLETTVEVGGGSSAVCPWDEPDEPPTTQAPKPVPAAVPAASTTPVQLSVCPWEQEEEPAAVTPAAATSAAAQLPAIKTSAQRLTSTSSDNTEVADRLQRNLGIRHQNTVDSGETSGMKRLLPNFTEQRRASVSFTPSRISEFPTGRPSTGAKISTTPSPTVTLQQGNISALFAPIQGPHFAATAVVTKDPPSSSDAEVEEELNKLTISERNSESSGSAVLPTPNPTPTPPPPPVTKVTPPPETAEEPTALVSAETQTQAEESPRESSPSDSLHGNEPEERSAGNEAEFEAEVDSEIQEVQIELIESSEGYEKLCESQECLEMSPPTIQVDDDDEDRAGHKEGNKSPQEATNEFPAGDTEMAEEMSSDQVKEKSPAASAKHSPEKEIAPETQEAGNETSSPMQQEQPEQPQPQPPTQEELPPTSPTEELSPTTDEYQEGLEFGDDGKNDFDIADTESTVGYIPPAPTPAPSMAPLAEMDTDTVDEEFSEELKPKETATTTTTTTPVAEKTSKLPHSNVVKTTAEEARKKRKKRHLDAKKSISGEEKEKEKATTSSAVATATVVKETSSAKPEADLTTVCPWEDDMVYLYRNVTTSDGTFTKTYATLGYL
uniref:Regulator of G protein signaling n=1 Tax=Musca domestica TaxID=7370 RepID=A0A1I8MRN3_MUSDO